MNNERFSIPEILFQPSIVGISQAGIAESIWNSIEQLPERMHIVLLNLKEKLSIEF